jgi:hypothetical protein
LSETERKVTNDINFVNAKVVWRKKVMARGTVLVFVVVRGVGPSVSGATFAGSNKWLLATLSWGRRGGSRRTGERIEGVKREGSGSDGRTGAVIGGVAFVAS